MRRWWPLVPAVILFLIGWLLLAAPANADNPWPPDQPRPDRFSCGTVTCDTLNPVNKKVLVTQSIAYRVVVEPGCTAGIIPQELARMNQHVVDRVAITLVRNDSVYDFTVHINCGSEQIRICGSVNTYCLGRGFPYNVDVDISDILSTYYSDSRLSILLHEILGHALLSWNEQYATCGASCNFQPSAGWRDIMNTGPDSRHGLELVELDRIVRSGLRLRGACEGDPCWDGSAWQFSAKTCPTIEGRACYWSPQPAPYGTWLDSFGQPIWDVCDPSWNGRHFKLRGGWMSAGTGFFDDINLTRYIAPGC